MPAILIVWSRNSKSSQMHGFVNDVNHLLPDKGETMLTTLIISVKSQKELTS